jgi:hypothetical protein
MQLFCFILGIIVSSGKYLQYSLWHILPLIALFIFISGMYNTENHFGTYFQVTLTFFDVDSTYTGA